MVQADGVECAGRERVAALVRAIRRAYVSPAGYGGVERFIVGNVHDFARRLIEEGVSPPVGSAS
jgi:hypothetical protein